MPHQEQEPQSQHKGPPAGWRYAVPSKHRSRFRGWLAQVWRGAKNNAALVSLVGVVLTLLVTTVLTQQGWVNQQRLENQRAQAAARVAEQQAQQESLQTYLDQMTTLLLEKNLRESEEGSEVRTLARAKTLTVLLGLDAQSKRILLQFLVEAELVQSIEGRGHIFRPPISLGGADLSDADLSYANLSDAVLSEANLSFANLSRATLEDADLSNAILRGANLSYAKLRHAVLSDADLRGADLSDADLSKSNLSRADLIDAYVSGADLSRATLSGAYLHDADLSHANLGGADLGVANMGNLGGAGQPTGGGLPTTLSGADLHDAFLQGTDLRGADLRGADLRGANLIFAHLRGAYLQRANLRGATGLSDEKIAAVASLEGATMPDGSEHP